MSLLGLSVVGVWWLAAVEAPVTSVTVYSDRARVVRTAKVSLSGTQRVELPALYGLVDPSSIRVEAQGAEVVRVDMRPMTSEPLPTTEARRLITELERLDDRLSQVRAERDVYSTQLSALSELRPRAPEPPAEPVSTKTAAGPSRLEASGWRAATDFLVEHTARLQAKLREASQRDEALERELALKVREARALGSTEPRQGLLVVPTLMGQGGVTLTVTYVALGARWFPTYELRLEPESNHVAVSFAGRVSQETGEDWNDAALTLSTAQPAQATRVPEPTTWKIGQRERFIPTPAPVADSWREPPPLPEPLPPPPDEDARLRDRLLSLANSPPASASQRDDKADEGASFGGMAPPPPPPPPPSPSVEVSQDFVGRITMNTPGGRGGASRQSALAPSSSSAGAFPESAPGAPPAPGVSVGLAPPEAWRPPVMDPNLPASLAGGYALAFPAQRHETVLSGKGERRVPLFTERWPVQVERDLYPALTPNAFLVAQLRGPSQQVLPGGEAQLFVGADPAGQARLGVVAPDEPFTLPLGIDSAVRPVRNVQLVTREKGLLDKQDITEYRVTLEVANPYAFPLALRLHDQWPLSRDQNVEVKLVRTEPFAEQDEAKGTLLWRVSVPPSRKLSVSFVYSVRAPKGWGLSQNQ
jgi:hypothetical protein